MSRNSKMARKTREAREWSARRKGGGKGPVKTQPKHGKVNRRPYGQSRNSPTKKEEVLSLNIVANSVPDGSSLMSLCFIFH